MPHFEQETLRRSPACVRAWGMPGRWTIQKIKREAVCLLTSRRSESYPNLKTGAVITTMNAIREVEDEISRHRYTYNNIIQEFNTMLDTLPSSFIGTYARMHKQEYLNFEEDELRQKGYLTSEEIEPRLPEAKWD